MCYQVNIKPGWIKITAGAVHDAVVRKEFV